MGDSSTRDASSDKWLQRETPKHVALLTKIREKLELALEPQWEIDADGQRMPIPPDTTEAGTPDRHWCRAFARYASGFSAIVAAEHEKAKMYLLARRAGMNTITDDEYEREMIELGRAAVRELSDEEFTIEAERRLKVHLALGD